MHAVRWADIWPHLFIRPPESYELDSQDSSHYHPVSKFTVFADEDPGFAGKFLAKLSAPETRAGEVRIVPKESLPLSSLSDPHSFGFKTIRQAALETLRGPKVLP